MFDAMPVEVGQVQAGNVPRPHGNRADAGPTLPQVPSAPEAGMPTLDVAGWFGFLAPPKTPASVVTPIQDAIAKALTRSELIAQLEAQGVVPVGGRPRWGAYLSRSACAGAPSSPSTASRRSERAPSPPSGGLGWGPRAQRAK